MWSCWDSNSRQEKCSALTPNAIPLCYRAYTTKAGKNQNYILCWRYFVLHGVVSCRIVLYGVVSCVSIGQSSATWKSWETEFWKTFFLLIYALYIPEFLELHSKLLFRLLNYVWFPATVPADKDFFKVCLAAICMLFECYLVKCIKFLEHMLVQNIFT